MSVSQIINVIVNSKGAVTVKKQLTEIGNSARSTTTYLNSMRAILASALTFSGVSAITDVANQFTALTNRLKLVTDASEGVTQSWSRLMQIANSSYSTIDSTVDLYFRVAQAYKAWGESAEKAYQFTDLFQKAAILSGSSVQTTTQAVYQFGQALNKGKLDGDEFRSVLEGLPYVANLIQKSLGVTRAELYKMSASGLISVQRIKEAFEEAAGTITTDWSKITPTIGQALVVLRNNWVDFVGNIQSSTGVFSLVAKVIILIADNFNILALAISPVVASLVFLGGRAALGLVITGLTDMAGALKLAAAAQWLFNAAVSANPYVIAATAVAALVAAIIYFRNEIGLTNENLTILWNVAVEVFTYILTTLNPITAILNLIVTQFTTWGDLFRAIGSAAVLTGQTIVNMFSVVVASIKAAVVYAAKAFAPVFSDLMVLASDFYGLLKDIFGLISDSLSPAIEALEPVFKAVWEYLKPALTQFGQLLSDIISGWQVLGKYLSTNFGPIIKDVFDGWITILRAVISVINSIIQALRTAIALAQRLSGSGGGGGAGLGAHYGAQFYAGEFASGGAFKVGGTNSGRDTTPVAFRAERGERVTVETKKQQRANDNTQQVADVNVPVSITNVLDPRGIADTAYDTDYGRKKFINLIKINRDEVREALGSY